MPMYCGVNGAKREIKELYCGIGGAKRTITEMWAGIDGAKKQIFSSAKEIGSLPVGSTVKLKENGVPQDYLVVHQGLPSSMYDASCNGTWILRKNGYSLEKYDAFGTIKFTSSDLFTECVRFVSSYGIFEEEIANLFKTVKIPYYNGKTVQSGQNGEACKCFPLSTREYGFGYTGYGGAFPKDGAKLGYFLSSDSSEADSLRISYFDGYPRDHLTRSANLARQGQVWVVNSSGGYKTVYPDYRAALRPAMVLPSTLLVYDDGTISA